MSEHSNRPPGNKESKSARWKHTADRIFAYTIDLIPTALGYSKLQDSLPEGLHVSSAAEELQIVRECEKEGADPRYRRPFDDLFGRNPKRWRAWQLTNTGLRIPPGYSAEKYQKDAKGGKYWPRIVLDGEHEVGEVLVPEGEGSVVVDWNQFGLPASTSSDESDFTPERTTHFFFSPRPRRAGIAGRYDVVVTLRGGFLLGEYGSHQRGRGPCFLMEVGNAREEFYRDYGYRLVRECHQAKLASIIEHGA